MHFTPDLGWFELTSRQRSIWLDLQTSGSLTHFQAGAYAEIKLEIDESILRDAVRDVMDRHDALRLRIDQHQPRQRIELMVEPPVEFLDFSEKTEPEVAALNFIHQLFTQPFPITSSPLFQFYAIRVSREDYYCLIRIHHIAFDAIGISILFRDIANTYDAMIAGDDSARQTSSYLPFQIEDATYTGSTRLKRDLDYWEARLKNLPKGLYSLRSRSSKGGEHPGVVTAKISSDDYIRFLECCSNNNLRVGNTLYALFSLLFMSTKSSKEMVLGIATPGRKKDAHSTIGLFSSVLPLRVEIDPEQSLADLVRQITRSLGRDYLHHLAPIDDICRRIGLMQLKRHNVFDVMISYMPLDVVDPYLNFGSETLRPVPIRGQDANPLAIYASELSEERSLTLEFAFNPDYLDRGEVENLSKEFARILVAFSMDPALPVSAIVPTIEAGAQPIALHDDGAATPRDEADLLHFRVLTGFTADPIIAPLKFWLDRLGFGGKVSLSDYNQVFQELIETTSPTRRNRNGANLVLLRLEDWLRDRPAAIGENSNDHDDWLFLSQVSSEFIDAVAKAAANSSVPYIVAICPPSTQWDSGGNREDMQAALLSVIRDGFAATSGVHLVTYPEVRRLYPVDIEYDAAADQLGHLPYTRPAFVALATMLARRVNLALRPPIKVIAVDCDNTLWDGVVGEDGVEGIRFDAHHLKLQGRLVAAAKNGVLICLCSKNLETDILSVFDQRDDMVLRLEHIVAHRINWSPKSENLRSLAAELNLGLDSFVMLDDNPVEIGEISANCPQVLAIPCTSDHDFGSFDFDHLWPLDVHVATSEDRKRLERYRQNAMRSKAQETATDYRDFISGLGIKIRIERPSDADLTRLAQLTERTNQFNINGRRWSIAELNAKRGGRDSAVFSVFVEDKFGDYGLVGLLVAHRNDDDLVVDSLLMSCRVLGRGVEHKMIAELGKVASDLGAARIRIPVRTTSRNLPVRQFLATLDMEREASGDIDFYSLTQQSAEACTFNPASAGPSELPEEPKARPASVGERHVDGAGWRDIATVLSSVDNIQQAIRSVPVAREATQSDWRRPPESETELALAALLCETLEIETIGADDDFFELGLHSLAAVQLVSRLREKLDVQVPVRALFEYPTVAKLAKEIDSDTRGSGYQPLVPLQVGDGTSPIFCCHPGNGDAVGYMRLANALGAKQTVYGFEASGLAPGEPLATSMEEMARVYVKAMIAAYPSGPYNLIGWSFGGGLAFEMVRQIEAAGREVGVLAFMDCVAPEKDSNRTAEDFKMTDDILLEGLTAQIHVLAEYFGSEVTGDVGKQLGWTDVMSNFQRFGVVPKGYTADDMQRKMAVFSNCVLLFNRYKAGVIRAPILHFRALEKLGNWDYDWAPYTTAWVSNLRIQCNHFLLGFEPHVNEVAKHLLAAIRVGTPRTDWSSPGTGVLADDSEPLPISVNGA